MRFDYVVAALGENHLRQLTYGGLVFNKQDGFVGFVRCGRERLRRRQILDCILDTRQVDLEGGAFSQLAVHPDVATALLHDAVYRR